MQFESMNQARLYVSSMSFRPALSIANMLKGQTQLGLSKMLLPMPQLVGQMNWNYLQEPSGCVPFANLYRSLRYVGVPRDRVWNWSGPMGALGHSKQSV